jgi:putative phage-type endonuclease
MGIVKELPYSKTIGGHAIASIMGVNPNETATGLWEILTGKRQSDFEANLLSDAGHALQPVILHHWAKENDTSYDQEVCYIDDEYDFMTGHIDAIQYNSYIHQSEPMLIHEYTNIIEVKTVYFQKAYLFGENLTDQIPYNYMVQCAWYCMLTKLPFARLLVFANGRLNEYRYERDMQIEESLREQAIEFWYENVLADKPPFPATSKEIDNYYKNSNGICFEASHEQARIIYRLAEIKQAMKDLKKEYKDLEDSIKLQMAEHDAITINGKSKITWKSHETSMFDKEGLLAAHPELSNLFETYTKKVTVRPLRVK